MKKNILLYGIIIVLACGITATTTYIIMKDNDKTDTKEENKPKDQEKEPVVLKDGVKFKKAYSLNDTIVEEFEVTLNGKKETLALNFDYYKSDFFNISEHIITVSYQDFDFYKYSKNDEYTYDNNEVRITHAYQKSELFNTNELKQIIREDDFEIIKGTDNKNYLLLKANNYSEEYQSLNDLLVFNDNLDLISKNLIAEGNGPDFEPHHGFVLNEYIGNVPIKMENKEFYSNYKYVKIENNKIYFLATILNEQYQQNNYGIVEERVYTLNNNKLEYEVINSYKLIEIAQEL